MKTTTGALEAAQEAVTELREALARAGITLPSLGLDVVTLAADPPRPLVELGCCTAETARLIAAALSPGEESRS
ncbi:hypothetical protein ABZY68_07740 [Streptomyces sp. NPDC006482]|uniref:hypothetical protein n=1 Tax=unclassified Streptomyces TaxID=2593676 RepID=UPI00224E4813|nr:hypothetical protein [Streptomyces sp. NBC_00094]MCX5390612.1 hypothetical protein [Streptomyces sp. NBC_00094]